MHHIRNRQPALGVHGRHAPKAGRPHGRTVIGVVPGDDHRLFRLALRRPVMAHQADVGVVGLRTAGGEEHVVDIPRRQFRQLRGQGDGGHMGGLEEGVVIGHLAHLAGRGLGQFLAPVADVHAPQPGHGVKDLHALRIGEHHAAGRGDHPRALRRQFRPGGEGMHVMGGIQRLQPFGGHVVGNRLHRFSPVLRTAIRSTADARAPTARSRAGTRPVPHA